MDATTGADIPSSSPGSQVNPKGDGDEMSGARSRVGLPGGHLLGREGERDAVDRLLDGGRAGRGGVMVVHGEPGIGKTALLECALEAGREFRVARISGVETEMELAFAALQRLCLPYIQLMEHLPEPQRDALAVAFGLGAGPAQSPFLVGLRSSASSRRLPRSVRFCASSMTRSGSIPRPREPWPLWDAGCWPRRSRLSLRHASWAGSCGACRN